MLTQIENKHGVISYDAALVDDIIKDAIKPFEGNAWISNYKGQPSEFWVSVRGIDSLFERDIKMTEQGVYVKLYVVLRFGQSVSSFVSQVSEYINDKITNCLELPVDNIEIVLTGTLSKRIAQREVHYFFRKDSD